MSGRRVFIVTPAFFLLLLSSNVPAMERYVAHPPRGNDSNPGTKAFPFATIQRGIDASFTGDSVIVSPGAYVESIDFDGKNIVVRSTDPYDPDVVANTIIDGNTKGSVVTFSGTETEACTLSGFTIRNGANVDYGGGICGGSLAAPTQATIQNNTITGNEATRGAGIIFCDGLIQNNTISGNSVSGEGGGLANCNGTIQNNTIRGNSATSGGGLYKCDGLIQNNTIAANPVSDEGGGLANCNGTIQNNTIRGNSATSGGGLENCDGTIRNNAIIGNTTGAMGGGGLANCDGAILNNTIGGNSTAGSGGGAHSCHGTIRNCVVWGNTADLGGAQLQNCSVPTYSCIQAWTGGGQGNIVDDPDFVDPDGPDDDPASHADNNYRLWAGSPCIDAGVNDSWMQSTTDLDGNPRILHGGSSFTVDVGAYEYARSFRISRIFVAENGALHITWASRPGDQYTVWSCTDLTFGTWAHEQTLLSMSDSATWTESVPSGSRKFYIVELE